MIEIITIIGLLIYIGYKEYTVAKERKDLIKAVMSKNLTEYVVNDKMDTKKAEEKPAEYVAAENLDDKAFDEMIKKQVNLPKEPKTDIKQRVAEKLFKKNAK